ncbi:MAG: DUF86 domain-containing protein [Campylobacterales bacterium]|nr:DUF86 domain-containing protein [Campylobacterales bacterium]
MYEQKDIDKLKLIVEKIELIEEIVQDFKAISLALKDKKMGKPSITMHLISMAEQFNRLKNDGAYEILSKFDQSDLKGSYDIRNFIAHDYEGVNLMIVEMVVREKLPKIKAVTLEILKENIDENTNCS